MQLTGYRIDEVIHALGETVVAVATAADGARVVLKYLDNPRPTPEFMARWRHEFAVLQSIDSAHVIKALGVSHDRQISAVRLSLGRATSEADIDHAADALERIVARLRGHAAPGARTYAASPAG